MTKNIAQVTTKIYEALADLSGEERIRAVNAALTLFGDKPIGSAPNAGEHRHESHADHKGESGVVSAQGREWQKQQNIKESILESMFHFEKDGVKLIGDPPGKSKREKTFNTYILTGIATYLHDGTLEFADEVARRNCEHFGCYDSPNNAKYLTQFDNKLTGSKNSGWKITKPGLTHGAKILNAIVEDKE